MFHKFKNELNTNRHYLVLGYIISILTMLPQFYVAPPLSPDSNHLIFLLIVLVMLFFIVKFSKVLFSIFIIYLNISNIIIGHIFMHWGYTNATIAPRIGVAVISPNSEIFEYLTAYIDYRDIALVLYSITMLVVLYKYVSHFKHTLKIIKFIGFIVSIAIMTVVGYYKNPLLYKEPFSIPYECIQASNASKLYETRKEYLNHTKIKHNQNVKPIYDKIIVIQGESVNKNHMEIYGYDKKTTPFFTSLKSEGNLVVLNAISPANLTHLSIPVLYTKANVHNFSNAFTHSVSTITNFKNIGYKTYWISNQGQAGVSDTNIASIAEEADVRHFENMDYMNAKPDEVMTAYIEGIKSTQDKEMYFIHLMGSHSDYAKRYTTNNVLFSKPTTIQEEYDNSIYYTDYILKRLFNHFLQKYSTKNILIIYMSDHGEIVLEEKHGHGFFPPYRDELDIPFVIYSNIPNERIDKLVDRNKQHFFNLENLNYMIDYISGISTEDNISLSKYIFAADPNNIYDYNQLKYYKGNIK